MKKISEIPRWAYTEKGMSCKKRRDIAIFIHQFTLKELIIDNIKELQKESDTIMEKHKIDGCEDDEKCVSQDRIQTIIRAKIKVLKEIFEIDDEDD